MNQRYPQEQHPGHYHRQRQRNDGHHQQQRPRRNESFSINSRYIPLLCLSFLIILGFIFPAKELNSILSTYKEENNAHHEQQQRQYQNQHQQQHQQHQHQQEQQQQQEQHQQHQQHHHQYDQHGQHRNEKNNDSRQHDTIRTTNRKNDRRKNGRVRRIINRRNGENNTSHKDDNKDNSRYIDTFMVQFYNDLKNDNIDRTNDHYLLHDTYQTRNNTNNNNNNNTNPNRTKNHVNLSSTSNTSFDKSKATTPTATRKDTAKRGKLPRVVHVWSPYVVRSEKRSLHDDTDDNDTDTDNVNTKHNKNNNPFFPLDQAQNVTWQSMYNAQQDYNRCHPDTPIHIYCAVLWMDVDLIRNHNPPLCRHHRPSDNQGTVGSSSSSANIPTNHLVILNRSSHTVYPTIEPPIHFPFIQDILSAPFDGEIKSSSPSSPSRQSDDDDQSNNNTKIDDGENILHSDNNNSSSFDYVIFTNSDIALVQHFYTLIVKVITTYNYDAFLVDRRTIPNYLPEYENKKHIHDDDDDIHEDESNDMLLEEDENNTSDGNNNDEDDDDDVHDDDILITSKNLNLVEANNILAQYGTDHPGSDCFILQTNIIQHHVNFGNLFVGTPPWAGVIKMILLHFISYNFYTYTSNEEYSWTYHLNDDRIWMKRHRTISVSSNDAREMCPIYHHHLHTNNHQHNNENSDGNNQQEQQQGKEQKQRLYSEHWYQNMINCGTICNGEDTDSSSSSSSSSPSSSFLNITHDISAHVNKVLPKLTDDIYQQVQEYDHVGMKAFSSDTLHIFDTLFEEIFSRNNSADNLIASHTPNFVPKNHHASSPSLPSSKERFFRVSIRSAAIESWKKQWKSEQRKKNEREYKKYMQLKIEEEERLRRQDYAARRTVGGFIQSLSHSFATTNHHRNHYHGQQEEIAKKRYYDTTRHETRNQKHRR